MQQDGQRIRAAPAGRGAHQAAIRRRGVAVGRSRPAPRFATVHRAVGLRDAGVADTMALAPRCKTMACMTELHDATSTSDAGRLADLLRDVAGGDRDAFETLYRSSAPRLMAICLRVLHDRGEAEDVLQDVFVRIWHKAAQFDAGKAGAMAWLATIARNKAIDRVRARPANLALAPIELVDDIADEQPTPLQGSERAQERSRLDACMAALESQRRTLIRAAFFDGSTYEELARRAGAPLGSVKSWIRRGLMQLRTCLEQ